jgi:stage V sporulation protein G
MPKQVPIYTAGAYDYAREHGEIAELRASLDANHAVQDYLRNDMGKYYVGGERFNATSLMQDLKNEFGLDRAMHVLLASVNDWDRRFTKATVDRATAESFISAKTDDNPGDFERNSCYTDMHPVYLDEVIKKGLQMEREQEIIRTNTPHFNLGETYKDLSGKEFKVVAEPVDDGKQVSITGVDEKGWRFEIEPQFEILNGSVVLTPVVEAPLTDSMIHDYWDYKTEQPIPMTFEDFKIGTTYLNHNGSSYTVLDKGMTYYDETFIKVQSVTDKPDQAWIAWAVRPEIGADGTLEWAYSKERDMTVPPKEKNIFTEEEKMKKSIKIEANMTALMQGTEKDPSFRGFASVTINDSFAIGNIPVRENTNPEYPNAYYAEMPSVKIGDNYIPVVYASSEAREAVNKAISEAYQAALIHGKGELTYPLAETSLEAKKNAKPLSVSVKDNPYDNSAVKAYAKVTLDSHFEINRVKICSGKNGDFISMPSRKGNDGEYRDIVKPITTEAREALIGAVMDKYAEHQKVIGNMEYGEIKDKRYANIKPEDAAEIIPKLYEQNLGFSSLPKDSTITLTYSRADEEKINAIIAPYVEMSLADGERSDIIGNTRYDDIEDKAFKSVSANLKDKTVEFLENRNVAYSAKSYDNGTYTFTVNADDKWKLDAAVDVAKIGGLTQLPNKDDIRDFQSKAGQQIEAQTRDSIKQERE